MKKKFSILSLLLLALFGIDLLVGNTFFSPNIIAHLWDNSSAYDIYSVLLIDFRLPKALTALSAGIALGISGLLLQTFFRNPLAGPDVLGVSSGASLGVSVFVMAVSAFPLPVFLLNAGQIAAATMGALLVLGIILAVAQHTRNANALLIIGIMLGSVSSSIVCILQSITNPELLKAYVLWTMGNLGATTWQSLCLILPVTLFIALVCLLLAKPLNLWILGEDNAQTLGLSIKKTRTVILLTAGILSGTITAFVGPIAFVGIAVPHIAKGIFRTFDHRTLLVACAICGAATMLLCDILSQLPANPIPINAVTSLLGGPMIIWIILKGEKI